MPNGAAPEPAVQDQSRTACALLKFLSAGRVLEACSVNEKPGAKLDRVSPPHKRARIRSGQWDAVRENLLLVLESDPAATPLF